jgi:hypothetical protein
VPSLTLSVALGVALAVCARGEDFKLPEDNPVASFTIPDSWKPSRYHKGVKGTSDDGAVYIEVEPADTTSSKSATKAVSLAVAHVMKRGVTMDFDSGEQSKSKINGMHVTNVIWKGKDADHDCVVRITTFVVAPNKGLLRTAR